MKEFVSWITNTTIIVKCSTAATGRSRLTRCNSNCTGEAPWGISQNLTALAATQALNKNYFPSQLNNIIRDREGNKDT